MKNTSSGPELPGGGGVILVDKAQGRTSHDVVADLRRLLGTPRVGHTGTLDPMATGLLVMCAGTATKLSSYLSGQDKEYLGAVKFGEITDTLDATGQVVERRPLDGALDEARLRKAMSTLTGELEQVPPMTSAVKVGGVRLHKLARKGLEVERKARTVKVEAFELTGVGEYSATFRVACSSGTYVRCLASELGRIMGFGAHLSELRRIRVGRFSVGNSTTIDALREKGPEKALRDHMIAPAEAVGFLPSVILDAAGVRTVRHGGSPPPASVLRWDTRGPQSTGPVRVLDGRGELHALAVMDREGDDGRPLSIRPVRVLTGAG